MNNRRKLFKRCHSRARPYDAFKLGQDAPWIHIPLNDFKLTLLDLNHALELESRNDSAFFELGSFLYLRQRLNTFPHISPTEFFLEVDKFFTPPLFTPFIMDKTICKIRTSKNIFLKKLQTSLSASDKLSSSVFL